MAEFDNNTFDERDAGPFAPDTVLPEQFFWSLKRRGELDGERRLMMAVLEDGVACFQKHGQTTDPKRRQLFVDAKEWITSTDTTWFFSFENVCATLGLDADYLRAGLLEGQRARAAAGGESVAAAVADPTDTLRAAS
jgi:hypothetical protein